MAKVYATGKRKTAIAKVWLEVGKGEITVKDQPLDIWLGGHEAIKKRVKLPFASFYEPSICNKNIYVVEKGGYLLKITPSLEVSVYSGNDFKLGEWDRLKILNCKIYNSNKVFTIE